MSISTLSSRAPGHADSDLPGQLWRALSATTAVLLSMRHDVGQRHAMQDLLRRSNQCEATDPVQAEALRHEAAALID